MNKKLIMLTLTAVLLVSAFFIGIHLLSTAPENEEVPSPTSSPTATPSSTPTLTPTPSGEYLHYRTSCEGGAETKAFLVNSQLYYGVYEENITRPGYGTNSTWCTANAGDPCVIISGTIRNDYDKDYYFAITADVYNSKGEIIGPFGSEWPILTSSAPMPGFTVAHVHSGAVGSFEMQIKYDAEDIVSYTLFLAWQPTEIHPP
ncbi:MAG TPA: hypothetical protein VI864_05065 [Candidatus Bathyarchaeia archaeon]|nr:hypothetical protein [Candidatus Bathyarchaeia archaeon]